MKILSIEQKNSATSLMQSTPSAIKKYLAILFLALPLVALNGGLAMAGECRCQVLTIDNT